MLRKQIKAVLWASCIAWFLMLMFLSSEEGPETARRGLWMANLIVRLTGRPAWHVYRVHSALRTLAHFAGFFVLGALGYATLYVSWDKSRHVLLWSMLLFTVIGVMDEVRKLFISGRHMDLEEAFLNVLGALLGIGLCVLVKRLVIRHRTHKMLAKSNYG